MAGTSFSAPHPTITSLYPVITDSLNSNLIIFGYYTGSGSMNTAANTYQDGAVVLYTSPASGSSQLLQNTGSAATPVWTPMVGAGIASANNPTVPLFLLDNGPSAGVIVVTAYTTGTALVSLTTGTMAAIRVKNAITPGAVTINFNGTTKSLKKHTANSNITTSYAAGGTIHAIYTPGQFGGVWQSLSDN